MSWTLGEDSEEMKDVLQPTAGLGCTACGRESREAGSDSMSDHYTPAASKMPWLVLSQAGRQRGV